MSDERVWHAINKITNVLGMMKTDVQVGAILPRIQNNEYRKVLHAFYKDNKDKCESYIFDLHEPTVGSTDKIWLSFKQRGLPLVKVDLRMLKWDDNGKLHTEDRDGQQKHILVRTPKITAKVDSDHMNRDNSKFEMMYTDDYHLNNYPLYAEFVRFGNTPYPYEFPFTVGVVIRIDREKQMWLLYEIKIHDTWKRYFDIGKINTVEEIAEALPTMEHVYRYLTTTFQQNMAPRTGHTYDTIFPHTVIGELISLYNGRDVIHGRAMPDDEDSQGELYRWK
jgi:hypothetical protein